MSDLVSSLATTTTTTKNITTIDAALPYLKSYAMGNLVDASSGVQPLSALSKEKIDALYERQQQGGGGDLVKISSLSAQQKAQMQLNVAKERERLYGATETTNNNRLVSASTFSPEVLKQVRLNTEKERRARNTTMQNTNNTLRQKAAFDAHFTSSLSNPLRSVFLGKPFTNLESESGGRPAAIDLLAHLSTNYPHLKPSLKKDAPLATLMQRLTQTKRDFLVLVPPPGGISSFQASNIVLLSGADAPILGDVKDRTLYSYQTAASATDRVELRRLGNETIEVNGRATAKLDRDSQERVYVLSNHRHKHHHQHEDDEEEENERTKQTYAVTWEDLTTLSSDAVRVDEIGLASPQETQTLAAVNKFTAYRAPKLGLLTGAMLGANFNAPRDLKNYMAPTGGDTAAVKGDLFLKLYGMDDLLQRHIQATMISQEYLTPVASYRISSSGAHTIDLDNQLTMRQYPIDQATTPIKKSALINGVAVLSFVHADKEEPQRHLLSALSFRVSAAAENQNLYLSSDESVLLQFKNNMLDSISLNCAQCGNAPCCRLGASAATSGKTDLNNLIALQVTLDKHAFSQLNARELKFDEFADLITPLCAPRILKRAKAAFKTTTTKAIPLTESTEDPMSLDADEKEGTARTERVMFMWGEHKGLMAKNKRSVTFQKQTYHNSEATNEKIDVYTRRGGGGGGGGTGVSFKKLVNAYRQTSKLLSVTLRDPLQGGKEKTFLFKLANTDGVGTTYHHYHADKGGLTFHFELDDQGDVQRLLVEYMLGSAGGGHHGRKASTTTMMKADVALLPTSKSGSGKTDAALVSFLGAEASKLNDLNLNVIGNTYLERRVDEMMRTVVLQQPNRKRALDFFVSLSDCLVAHSQQKTINLAQLNNTLFVTELTNQLRTDLSASLYICPQHADAERCRSVLASVEFEQLDAATTFNALLAAKKSNGDSERAYLSRLNALVGQLVCNLKK